MPGLVRIEVRAGRLEIRRLAFADRVNVNRVHARLGRGQIQVKEVPLGVAENVANPISLPVASFSTADAL